jgi:opacity protein-like surface antigen
MKLILLVAIFFLPVLASGQTDTCISNLKKASTEFDQGNYDFAIAKLNASLNGCNLSNEDRISANKLLILCYLAIDDLESAANTADAIMKADPNFQPDRFKDDPKLSALFSKYQPQPLLVIAVGGGVNLPVIKVDKTYSVIHDDDAENLSSYHTKAGYQLMAKVELRTYRNLWAEAGFRFRQTTYNHTVDSVQGSTVFYDETLNYFEVPLSLKYYFSKGRLQPYVQASADLSFLTRALSTTSRSTDQDIVDRTDLRNNFSVGWGGGAGLRYAINSLMIFGNVQYIFFPALVNKEGTRYNDDVNLYKYYYIDDDFRMDNIQFNIGIAYVLSYKIEKVK